MPNDKPQMIDKALKKRQAEEMRKWRKVAEQDDEDDCKIANALARAEDKEEGHD